MADSKLGAVVAAGAGTVLVSVVTTLVTTAVTTDPDIDLAGANAFYRDHYAKVFDPRQVEKSWETDLTENYRLYSMGSREKYLQRYQQRFSAIKVKAVEPVYGQTNQFVLRVQATLRKSGKLGADKTYVASLVCNDQLARLPFRHCRTDRIQIHVLVDTASSPANEG